MFPKYDHSISGGARKSTQSDGVVTNMTFKDRIATEKAITEPPELATRDRYWRQRWRRLAQDILTRYHNIKNLYKKYGVGHHLFARYLDLLSSYSDIYGRQAIYTRRDTLANQLDCTVTSISHCRALAAHLGLHSTPKQLRWQPQDLDQWCGGPSLIYLTHPTRILDTIKTVWQETKTAAKKKALKIKEAALKRKREKDDQRAAARLEASIAAAADYTHQPKPGKRNPTINQLIQQAKEKATGGHKPPN